MKPSASSDPGTVVTPEPVVVPILAVDKPLVLKELTDRPTIIWLLYNNVRWVELIKKAGYRTVFVYDASVADPYIDRWHSPEPIEVDIRRWLMAEQLFNSIVHDR